MYPGQNAVAAGNPNACYYATITQLALPTPTAITGADPIKDQIADKPRFYSAFVDVIGGQGNAKLDTRKVLFLVPPKDPGLK